MFSAANGGEELLFGWRCLNSHREQKQIESQTSRGFYRVFHFLVLIARFWLAKTVALFRSLQILHDDADQEMAANLGSLTVSANTAR